MFPTEVIVDYDILKDNFKAVQDFEQGVSLAPVVKADAYGHGLVKAARAFMEGGAGLLSVFRVDEALELRDSGVQCPVWILLGALPSEAARAVGRGFVLTVFDLEQARAVSEAALRAGVVQNVHVAVDTGMGRLGFRMGVFPKALESIMEMGGLNVRGIVSHVAKAYDPGHPVTARQVLRFRAAMAMLPPGCGENHLCATEAMFNRLAPELRYARPGICLYTEPAAGLGRPGTRDAMSVRTRLISVKDMEVGANVSYGCIRALSRPSKVAVAPIGYEDGYIRSLTDKGYALVRGRRAPVLGTICMSMTMLDVTDIEGVGVGDEAVFLGSQGEDKITVLELARLAGTTPHELLCSFGKHRTRG